MNADEFLKEAKATMTFERIGYCINPLWNDGVRRKQYDVILETPKGKMVFHFWDSVRNSESNRMPKKGDILSCLTTYDTGTMKDFFDECGYEINNGKDLTKFIRTYNAVVNEYNNVRRIFTDEQIKMLQELAGRGITT